MVCIGMPSLCLKKVIIAAAHILQTPADGNANLAAVDALYPRDFRLLDTGNVVGVNLSLIHIFFNQIHKKGARSTVWLLTPRLIDYIFPFSRSLQRYA